MQALVSRGQTVVCMIVGKMSYDIWILYVGRDVKLTSVGIEVRSSRYKLKTTFTFGRCVFGFVALRF